MRKGLFITFEGIRGAGKTTQSKLLYEYVLSQKIDTNLTKGIGETTFGNKIRSAILNESITSTTELLAILSDRSDYIEKILLPNLQKNAVIICDRFIDSTAVYQTRLLQGERSKNSYASIFRIHKQFFGNVLPDLTILLRGNTSLLCKRVITRNRIKDKQDFDYAIHHKLQNKFNQLQELHSNRIKIVDFTEKCTPEEIHNKIKVIIIPVLKESFFVKN